MEPIIEGGPKRCSEGRCARAPHPRNDSIWAGSFPCWPRFANRPRIVTSLARQSRSSIWASRSSTRSPVKFEIGAFFARPLTSPSAGWRGRRTAYGYVLRDPNNNTCDFFPWWKLNVMVNIPQSTGYYTVEADHPEHKPKIILIGYFGLREKWCRYEFWIIFWDPNFRQNA